MDTIELKIRNILANNVDIPIAVEQIESDMKMVDLGLSSVNYVKVLVEVEKAFNIEFDDDMLNMNSGEISTVHDLINFVLEKMQ